jgi:hypothetical protein
MIAQLFMAMARWRSTARGSLNICGDGKGREGDRTNKGIRELVFWGRTWMRPEAGGVKAAAKKGDGGTDVSQLDSSRAPTNLDPTHKHMSKS